VVVQVLLSGPANTRLSKEKNKSIAGDAGRARRRELELAVNRIRQRERMPLFEVAAQEWLDTKTGLAPNSHIRTAAKRAAIRSLEEANLERGGAQNEAQSQKVAANYLN
jgi:hypothetical protein